MATRRHAEIAGAGFAGLTAAAALARRGWSVRVHERAGNLRPGGFGLAMQTNGVRVLQALGALDAATEGSCRIAGRQTRDGDGRITSRMSYGGQVFRCSRRQVVEALADVARAHGAEIAVGSEAAAAEPDGTLVLADGRRLKADLVIAADGVNSALRDGLGLLRRRRLLGDGAMRLMIRRRPDELDGPDAELGIEHWSGPRRIIFSPCNREEIYIALSCLNGDERAKAVPIDAETWIASFPGAADLVRRIAADGEWDRVQWVRFQVISLKSWSRGRVAIAGDAAHAMTPNLGQGAMCAMTNALALAVALDETPDIERALALWERRERPLTEHTQRMSSVYGAVTTWPAGLRALALKAIARVGWLNEMFYRTARRTPTGTV